MTAPEHDDRELADALRDSWIEVARLRALNAELLEVLKVLVAQRADAWSASRPPAGLTAARKLIARLEDATP